MKKLVVVLCVLCSGLFFTNPILKSVFANSDSKANSQVVNIPEKTQNDIKPEETLNTNNATIDLKDREIKNTVSTNSNEHKNDQNNNNQNNDSVKDLSVKEDVADNNINSENQVSDNSQSKENQNNNSTVIEDENSLPAKDTTSNEAIISKTLTIDDALKILMDMNPNLVYEYKGDENTFTVLKDKGLSGYVFLPNIDTDLGYFVDKNTSNVYYFHPSGYLEKIK